MVERKVERVNAIENCSRKTIEKLKKQRILLVVVKKSAADFSQLHAQARESKIYCLGSS